MRTFRSKDPSGGALRISAAQPSEIGASRRQPPSCSGVILIAAAGPHTRASLGAPLSRSGYRVLAAGSRPAAAHAHSRQPVDALILDEDMLPIGGRDVVHELRDGQSGLPVIVLHRALGAARRRSLIHDLGVDGFHERTDPVERLIDLIECARATRRSSEELRTEQEARALLLAKFCHNLRSPLQVIRGYTDILRSEDGSDLVEGVLVRLSAATDAALRLVGDYLKLARLDASDASIERENVEIDLLVSELGKAAQQQIGERPLRFIASVPEPGASLPTDGEYLHEILLQLLSNAIACTREGDIELVVLPAAGEITFVLADRGPGVDPADLPQLFTPFRQRCGELCAPLPGQGVGLAICERLGALLGASLTVRPRRTGGSIFVLTVPRWNESDARPSPPTLH